MNALLGAGFALLLGAGLAHADANAVYQRHGDDGSVELTNIPDTPTDYQTIVGTPPPAVATTGNTVAVTPPAPDKPVPPSQGPMGDILRDLYNGARAAHQAAGR
jgi:hypothetical protein